MRLTGTAENRIICLARQMRGLSRLFRLLSRLDLGQRAHDLRQLGLEGLFVFVATEFARHLAEAFDPGLSGGRVGWVSVGHGCGHQWREGNMAKEPYRRGRGKCVFCDGASGASLSREHVLPNWLRRLFPRSPSDTHTHGVVSWAAGEGDILSPPQVASTQRSGQAGTRKVRAVCKKCNNEWLSVMEQDTQPLLESLILGERRIIDLPEQPKLAAWVAKTVMTAEFIELIQIR